MIKKTEKIKINKPAKNKTRDNFWVYLLILFFSVFFYSVFLFIFQIINFNGWLFASFVLHATFLSVFALKKIKYSGNASIAIVVGLICSVLLYVYSTVEFIPVFAHLPTEVNVVQLLFIGFLFPFAEEAFFREGIQKSLSSTIGSASVPITAVLGSLLHLPKIIFFALPAIPFLVLFFFLNLFWSAMYEARGSVEETTIAHTVYNVIVVLFF